MIHKIILGCVFYLDYGRKRDYNIIEYRKIMKKEHLL